MRVGHEREGAGDDIEAIVRIGAIGGQKQEGECRCDDQSQIGGNSLGIALQLAEDRPDVSLYPTPSVLRCSGSPSQRRHEVKAAGYAGDGCDHQERPPDEDQGRIFRPAPQQAG